MERTVGLGCKHCIVSLVLVHLLFDFCSCFVSFLHAPMLAQPFLATTSYNPSGNDDVGHIVTHTSHVRWIYWICGFVIIPIASFFVYFTIKPPNLRLCFVDVFES
jgi:hypothetical protein